MQVGKLQDSSSSSLNCSEVPAIHKRSRSFPGNRGHRDDVSVSPHECHRMKMDMENVTADVQRNRSRNNLQASLKKEILQLERRLQDQFVVRSALEKALGYGSSINNTSNENLMPKPTKELIKEIAVLELEVMILEQNLLSLYRQAFDQHVFSLSPSKSDERSIKFNLTSLVGQPLRVADIDKTPKKENRAVPFQHNEVSLPDTSVRQRKESNSFGTIDKLIDSGVQLSPSRNDERLMANFNLTPLVGQSLRVVGIDKTSKMENLAVQVQHSEISLPQDTTVRQRKESNSIGATDKLIDSGVQRSHSSLSHHSICSIKTSPIDSFDKSLPAFRSEPLFWMEENNDSEVISLAEQLGTRMSDHLTETPNQLSEDVIRCMGAIYCKLAEPALLNHGHSFSPSSSLSSASAFSPPDHCDTWSPPSGKEFSFDIQLDKSSQVEGLKETGAPFSAIVEITGICRDGQRLSDVQPMVQNFRSLVHRLEKIDPSRMKNDEKLAFWINIHNALVMHAYLSYGIPENNLKRGSLLMKAAYNVGGKVVSADTIQSSILGCRTQRTGQWLRTFFSPKMKFKASDGRKSYALDEVEPLLHFALCSGSHSDPPVRVYTAKRVLQELDAAKEEYLQATIGCRKERKIHVPKIVESFAKDSNLDSSELLDMVQHYLPEDQRKALRQSPGKSRIEWLPHNFSFRYMLLKELAK